MLVVVALVLSLAGLAPHGSARAQQAPASAQHEVQQAIYVKLTPNAAAAANVNAGADEASFGVQSLDALAQAYPVTALKRVFRPAGRFEDRHRRWGLDRWFEVRLADDVGVRSAARAYLSSAAVEAASPVYTKTLHGHPTHAAPLRLNGPTREAAARLAAPFFPDDPRYGEQWHYNNTGQTDVPADGEVGTPGVDINLPEAHDVTTGSPDVIVSVVDSGLDLDHPDFQGMLWINDAEDINGNGVFDRTPAADGGDLNGVDDDNNGYVDDVVGYDFADDDSIPETVNPTVIDNSHGTHVAGTIAARNNNGVGVAGVGGGDGTAGSGVRLMITQTFANNVDGFAEAIVYAADNGAVISNNSWGYTTPGVFEQPVLDAIDYFNANAGGPAAPIDGGIYVNSAGNSDSSADWYPGFYEGAYAVSSTEDTDSKSSFSNYGSWVDVAAPGGQFGIDGVISTVHRDAGEYASFSGTSMAAPHIAGAAALVASAMPGMTAEEVKALLSNSGVDVSALNPGFELGRRLDAFNALQGPDDVPPAAVTDLAVQTPSLSAIGTNVTVTWTAPGDDGTDGQAASYDLRYSLSGPITAASFDGATPIEGVPVPAPAGTAESYTVTGLPFSSEIWFALRTSDEFLNVSPVSNSPSIVTQEGPAFSVSTDSVGTSLLIGETATETFSISNDGDTDLDVQFLGFASLAATTQAGVRLNDTSPVTQSTNHAKGSDNLAGIGRPVTLGAGGPDGFGYNWIDSNEEDGPAYNWTDVSSSGTVVSAGDETVTSVDLPFEFSFYGETHTSVGIASNGYLIFGGGSTSDFSNNSIPDPAAPNNIVAPFWDDLDVSASGTVYSFYDEDNGRFIVQYDDVAKFLSSNRYTFQVVLYDNGTLAFLYEAMDDATSATIGIEGPDGTDGLQIAFNTAYVQNELAIAIQTAPPYLSLSPLATTLAPGSSQTFSVEFDASGLEQGVFTAPLEASVSNSSVTAGLAIQTGLEVTGAPFPFELSTDAFNESLVADASVTRTLTITNPETRERSFRIQLRGLAGQAPTFQPRLKGEQLAKYERMAASLKELAGRSAPSLTQATEPRSHALDFLPAPMDATNLDAYSTSVFGSQSGQFVTFDLGIPDVLTVLGPSPTAYAGDFAVGQQDRFYVITTDDNAFHSITTEGAITTFGLSEPVSSDESWTDLTANPVDGQLYATTSNGSASFIYLIDPTDGSATRLAQISGAPIVISFAVDEFGVVYGLEISSDELLEINPATGATSVIGSVGFDANFAQGMDYDLATGRLYLAAYNNDTGGELRIADVETGATTLVGPLGGGDELGYLALNSVGFVRPNLLAGTIAGGASADVELTITAENLYEGTYSGELQVVSDLPGMPMEGVDVQLAVDADPELALDVDSLVYDSLFIGLDETQAALVSNTGRADMEVSLSLDGSDDFAFVDGVATSFTLPAGVSREIPITFAPSSDGPLTAALTVNAGGAGTETVALVGVGLLPPEVVLSPAAFDLQAYPGQQYTRTLRMANTGGNPLVFSSNETVVAQPDAAAPAAVYEDVALAEDFEDGIPATWTVVDNAGTGVVWQLNDAYDSGNYAGTGNAATVDSDFAGSVPYDTELITPTLTATEAMTLEFLVNFQAFLPDDDQFFDVDFSTDGGATWTNALRLDDDTPPNGLFVENGGVLQSIAVASYVDPGTDFQARFRYYTTSSGFDWYAQVDDVRIVRNTFEYVSYAPTSGTVAPGDTLDVVYTIDATGLPGGTYQVDYTFTTNDPQVPSATVPLTLNVIESLAVTPAPGTGEDEVVHPNETFTVPLNVQSLDDLAVESYELTLDFDASLFEAESVETTGTLSEGLTLVSNVTEGSVQIAAADAGAEAAGAPTPVLFSIEGEGTLVTVTFRAKEALGVGEMTLSGVQFNEGQPAATGGSASVTVGPLYGDASLNLDVSAFDAALVLQQVVGLTALNEAAFTSAEVSGNGALSAFDAALILDYASRLRDCFPVEEGCEAPAALAAKSGSAPALAWGAPSVQTDAKTDAESGQRVDLPIVLTGSGDVRAFKLQTTVDAEALTIEAVESTLPEGWQVAHRIGEDGTFALAAFGPTPLPSGTLARVQARWLAPDTEMTLAGRATLNEAAPDDVATASLVTLPEKFALHGNFPNPVQARTQIGLDLPAAATVNLDVYDLLGRRIQSIRDKAMKAGTNRMLSLDFGRYAAGMYFYRVTVQMENGDRQVDTGRLTVVR
jgi:subtilisin family serine protease